MLEKFTLFLEQDTFISKSFIVISKIVIIVLFALIIKKLLVGLVLRYLDNKGTKQSLTLKAISESIIKYLIYFFALTAILDIFKVSLTSVIALAGLGSVAIGFGAQSLVKDVITGAFIIFEEQFAVGDYVELIGKSGMVEKIGLRTTLVRNSLTNEQYIIPNSEIKIVTNRSKDFQRALVNFEIPYEVDIDATVEIIRRALGEKLRDKSRLLSEPSVYGATAFNASGINIRVTCDTINGEVWAIEREIRNIVKKALDEHQISIPYTTQTINISNQDQ